MKRIFTLTLCFLLLFTNISFANRNDITEAIKDIELVNNRMDIMIKKITGDDPLDTEEFKKDIKFYESILGERLKKVADLYSSESNLEIRRTYSAVLYTASLYELSLSSMLVYVTDDSKTNYFIDTCSTYQQGITSLNHLKSKYY